MFRDAGLGQTYRAATLDEAVRIAHAAARTMAGPDRRPTVLLSPAAASFDMFEDYAARGRAFTDAVVKLGEERLKETER
jgi:UDP-N-acetylmuramoylalanine--D-glutamate ligase